MKKIKIFLSSIIVLLLVSGCAPVYRTVTSDIPLINHKNDLSIDAGVAIDLSAQTTISYGLTDKIAIQCFGSISDNEAYYIQAASGFYKLLNNNRVVEFYGGFGYGYGCGNKVPVDPGEIIGNYQVYYSQLNYGKIMSEISNTEFGIGIKTGYLHSNLTDYGYYVDIPDDVPFEYKDYKDDCVFVEPNGTVRFGMANIKLSLKLGATILYKFTHTDKNYPFSYFNLGLAVNLRKK